MHQRGSSQPGCYTFAFHAPSSVAHSWRLIDCPLNTIIIFPDNNELNSVSPPGYHTLTVSLAEDYLRRLCIDLGFPDLDKFVAKGEVVHCNSSHINNIQYTLLTLLSAIESIRLNSIPLAIDEIVKLKVIRQILTALSSAKSVKLTKPILKKNNVLNRYFDYLETNIAEDISITKLCSIAGVSERSLRYIFNEYFAVNPQKYIRHLRLHKIRKELTNLDNLVVKISDIANLKGLWHMGKFAADYRSILTNYQVTL